MTGAPQALVPAYGWPTSDEAWAQLLQGEPGIAVMVGPDSGPGQAHSAALDARITSVEAAGWQAVGYVALDYLGLPMGPRHEAGLRRRSLIDITRDITAYRSWYPRLGGVFYDECPGPGTGVLEALLALEAIAVRLREPCIFNPGVAVDARWFDVLARSIIVTYEGTLADYPGQRMVGDRCAHLVHHAPQAPAWPAGLGWAFSTKDSDSNVYDGVLN